MPALRVKGSPENAYGVQDRWRRVNVRLPVILALLAAPAVAGCIVGPDQDDALSAYLASDVGARGEDCPFQPDPDVKPGGTELPPGAHDIDVAPDGTVFVVYVDEVIVLDPGLDFQASWDLPEVGPSRGMSVAAGAGEVAVAHFPVREDHDPDDYEGRGVIVYDRQGRRQATWEVEQVRGMMADVPDGELVVLHDRGRDKTDATFLTPDLTVRRGFTVPDQGTGIRDGDRCRDRYLWLDSWDHDVGGGSSRVVVTDGEGRTVHEWGSGREPTRTTVGHDLMVVPYSLLEGAVLQVFDTDGNMLLERQTDGRFGLFDLSHGMVYRLGDGNLTGRPIPSFLRDPPGEPA